MAVYTKYKTATEFSWRDIEMNRSVNFVEQIDGETLSDVTNNLFIDPSHTSPKTTAVTTRHPMNINTYPQANNLQAEHITADTHNGGQAQSQMETAAGRGENYPAASTKTPQLELRSGSWERDPARKAASVPNRFRNKQFDENSSQATLRIIRD